MEGEAFAPSRHIGAIESKIPFEPCEAVLRTLRGRLISLREIMTA